MATNPYARKDGTPIPGKEFEFLDWTIAQDKAKIDKLPPDEKKKELKARKHLRDKMES